MSKKTIKNLPPRWAMRFLRWVCPEDLFEEIEGDIIQKFHKDLDSPSVPHLRTETKIKRANRRLIWNVIGFLRPGIVMRKRFAILKNRNLMLRIHAKVLARQFASNKAFSIVNVLGLTLGFAACLTITQFVVFEWNFERHNKNIDRLYRVNLYNTQNGVFDQISSRTTSGLAYSIQQSEPAVESIGRIGSPTSAIVTSTSTRRENQEDNIAYADPSIIDILDLEFIEGDKQRVMRTPHSLILSTSIAEKYFGKTSAVGKTLEIGFSGATIEKRTYEVQGVFKDLPPNTHKHLDIVLPPNNEAAWNENWAWSNVMTYVLLHDGRQPQDLAPGLSKIVRQHHVDGADSDRYLLEPFADIRLYALDGSGRASLVYLFIALGIIILLLAWFNFVSLSTANFFERMKAVGIRRLVGASRRQLIFQFLIECFFYNLIALFAGILIFYLVWPLVPGLMNEMIPITLFRDPGMTLAIIAFIVASTFCSGFYPSLFLSSFKPLSAVRGRVMNFMDRSTLRKAIVIVQFSISCILVIAVYAIHKQLEYMGAQDIGIALDQTVIVEAPLLTDAASVDKYASVKNKILQDPNVKGVTYATNFAGYEIDWHRADIHLGQENAGIRYDSRIIGIGTEFLDVFKLPLVAGRNFNEEIESDKKAMLISEEASRMFGFPNHNAALGQLIFIGSRRFEVIGVVKDYHYRSLDAPIESILYMQGYPRDPRYAIKISSNDTRGTVARIESIWKEAYAGNVFRYFFLDDFFDLQYTDERHIAAIVKAFTAIAIFISCSGLFALSIYAVNRRTKEISIRKVFGATISNITLLLTRGYFRLITVASFLAIPLGYLLIREWLERYAYKMTVDLWLFIIPFSVVFILALITVSFQTITAAKRNPVDNIKYE